MDCIKVLNENVKRREKNKKIKIKDKNKKEM